MPRRGRQNKASKKNSSRQHQNRTKKQNSKRPRVSGRGSENPEIRHNQRIVRSAEQDTLDSIQQTLRRVIYRLSRLEDDLELNQVLNEESTSFIYNKLKEIRHLQLPFYYRIAGRFKLNLQKELTFQSETVIALGSIFLLLITFVFYSILV